MVSGKVLRVRMSSAVRTCLPTSCREPPDAHRGTGELHHGGFKAGHMFSQECVQLGALPAAPAPASLGSMVGRRSPDAGGVEDVLGPSRAEHQHFSRRMESFPLLFERRNSS